MSFKLTLVLIVQVKIATVLQNNSLHTAACLQSLPRKYQPQFSSLKVKCNVGRMIETLWIFCSINETMCSVHYGLYFCFVTSVTKLVLTQSSRPTLWVQRPHNKCLHQHYRKWFGWRYWSAVKKKCEEKVGGHNTSEQLNFQMKHWC